MPLTEESLNLLFVWKNGYRLSGKKLRSFVSNYPVDYNGDLEERYLDYRLNGGAIWNIFYLHCVDHKKYPIFDQDTFRAMYFMKYGKIEELPNTKKKIFDLYKEYRLFFQQLSEGDERKVDKALFTFGRYIKYTKKFA